MKKQKGSVLIISLLLLIVMTILAISSMNNTIMEERMAGNLFQRDSAFQAAEGALRAGEDYLNSLTKETKIEPGYDGASGIWIKNCPETKLVTAPTYDCETYDPDTCTGAACKDDGPTGNWWSMVDWTDAEGTGILVDDFADTTDIVGGDINSKGVFKYKNSAGLDGFYVLEYLEPVCDSAAVGQQSDQQTCADYYQVTAIGFGPGRRSRIFLRSTLTRRF
jgi:Tfp pilus assembly protein PilX